MDPGVDKPSGVDKAYLYTYALNDHYYGLYANFIAPFIRVECR